MSHVVRKLKEYWLSQNIELPPGATQKEIECFELSHKVRLPDDMREYLLEVNGLFDYTDAHDINGFCFWHLSRITTVSQTFSRKRSAYLNFDGAESYFLFADYMDWSWAYSIHLSPDPQAVNRVAIIGKTPSPVLISDSFTDFVQLYLSDSPVLYGIFEGHVQMLPKHGGKSP